MRNERINLVDGYISRDNVTVGPRHDPYSRDIYTIVRNGRKVEVIACGLAGTIVKTPEYEATDHDDRYDIDDVVLAETGLTLPWLEDRIWERRENARLRRMSPDQRMQYWAMQEADDFLLACAM